MVVEDDDDLREIICRELTSEGYAVRAARHGGEALDILSQTELPALILLDLMMPVVSGWAFRERQLADPRLAPIPVLVMTAAGATEAAIEATGLVRKPLDIERLLSAVSAYVPREFDAAPKTTPNGTVAKPIDAEDSSPHR